MAKTSSRRLFAGIAVVFVVLIAAVLIVWGAIIVFASRQVSAPPRPPGLIGYLNRADIDAPLALGSLAAISDREVIRQALAGGKWETALAALAVAESLSDLDRAGTLAILGSGYAAAKDADKADLCFQLLANLAVLSGDFHDYQKADLLLQAGDGLLALGKRDEASVTYDRIYELARYSPMLQSVTRAALLNTVAARYLAVNEPAKSLDASSAAGQTAPASPMTPVIAALPGRSIYWEDDPAWAPVKALTDLRVSAASDLMASLEGESSGVDEAKRRALETALTAEDEARDRFYTDQLQKETTTGARSAVAHARVAWLLLKWRVANQGFGISLAPGWEVKAGDIQASLRRAFEDDYALQLEMAAALPDPLEARQATIDILVDEIKSGRLGLYPNAPERGLVGDLTDAIAQRIALRDDATLYVVAATRNGDSNISFAFATAEQLVR